MPQAPNSSPRLPSRRKADGSFEARRGGARGQSRMLVLLVVGITCLLLGNVSNYLDYPAMLQSSFTSLEINVSYDLAYRESFGFFNDIADSDWKLHQERVRSDSLFQHPEAPETGVAQSVALWMLNNVDPVFTCPHARRVGGRGDGPKWICDPHRLRQQSDCLVYSVGSAGNYMFEDGLASIVGRGHCEFHVFDPNPSFARPGDVDTNNIQYHAWGLKSSYSDAMASQRSPAKDAQFYSLAEAMQKLGHAGRRIDVFKIDCEGCEWTSYKDWSSESVDIRQIQIEIHAATTRPADVTLSGFFQALLDRGFVPFFKEANTHPAARPASTLFEYAFLRLDPSFFVPCQVDLQTAWIPERCLEQVVVDETTILKQIFEPQSQA